MEIAKMDEATYAKTIGNEYWRLNNLYYIKDASGKKIKFSMRKEQKALYKAMWFLNVILKARQLGLTTFIQIFMLDRCLFNDNTTAGVIAHTQKDAETFFDDKIKFAYDNLPEDIKRVKSASTDSARELAFTNGSKIYVGTSMRSGTLQYLHVSEFGKMCAKFPEKAKEVVTGAFNTVAPGQFIFVESTAEGPSGKFYDMSMAALNMSIDIANGNAELTKMDYKFWFFPWFGNPRYVLEDTYVEIPEDMALYFEEIENELGIKLSIGQKQWYVKKSAEQGDDMKQEFPSTPQEAFQRAIAGAIFARQMRAARKHGRICELPMMRGVPVNTFWDLGRNDTNAIWFHQRVGGWDHFIYYYEYRLVDLGYYARKLLELKQEFDWMYGTHYLPHDVKVTDISQAQNLSRKQVLETAGVKPIVAVPRCASKLDSIEAGRNKFDNCKFDIKFCAEGIRRLETYKWVFDKTHEVFRKTPQHDESSNGADAYQQFAMGYSGPVSSVREQIDAHNGTGGRAYARGVKATNPLTNPDTSHIM